MGYATSWADLSPTERRYLIATVIGEARGEADMGIAGVAWVIRNRTLSDQFPDTIQSVVTQGRQFTPWMEGNPLALAESHRRTNPENYARIERILQQVYDGQIADPTNGALYFEAIHNASPWMDSRVDDGRLIRGISIITRPDGRIRTFEGNGRVSAAESGHRFYRDTQELNPAAGVLLNPQDVERLREIATQVWCGAPSTEQVILVNDTRLAFEVQGYLEQIGIATDRRGADGQVDGKIGGRTRDAIKRVEEVLGLNQDGILDEAVLEALRDSRLRTSMRLVLADESPSSPILSASRPDFATLGRT
jgi:hypothetical protein